MVKRKADSPPTLEVDAVGTNPVVASNEPPSNSTDNWEATNRGHVDEEETSELSLFWLLLSHAGYELW